SEKGNPQKYPQKKRKFVPIQVGQNSMQLVGQISMQFNRRVRPIQVFQQQDIEAIDQIDQSKHRSQYNDGCRHTWPGRSDDQV
ncbi:MAG: hypothetical protein LW865_13135, partial [Betaproteobacteria bacterium]|nr:hypothetical protein [Betaproteobacteria bacterium]